MSFPTRSKAFEKILDILDRRVEPGAAAARVDSMDSSDTDMGELRKAISWLTEKECPGVLLAALFKADNLVAETLWEQRGPFSVNLTSDASQTSHTLNGEPFELYRIKDTKQFMAATIPEDLVLTFNNIRTMGVTGVLETDQVKRSMIAAGNLDYAFDLVRSISFTGEIPVFANERVSNPELAVVLLQATMKSGDVYDPILCWASPEMVSRYPEQIGVFTSVQHFEVELRGSGITKTLTFPEWAESFTNTQGHNLLPDNYLLTGFPEDDSRTGHSLLTLMGSPALQHGFINRDGLVLCHTKASFLSEFEMTDFDVSKGRDCQVFVDKYLPLDIIVDRCFPDGYGNFKQNGLHPSNRYSAGVRPRSSRSRKEFMELLVDPDMGSKIKGLMTTEQWHHLARIQTLESSTFLALHRAIGFGNEGLSIKVERGYVDKMQKAGFRFSSKPYRLINSLKNMEAEEFLANGQTCVDLTSISRDQLPYEQLVDMGLWPTSVIPEPKDLASALASCARRKDVASKLDETSLSLRAYVYNAGVEACAEVASNPKQWAFMLDLFGPDAMRPYSRELPAESLGKVFAHDLGL